MKTLWLSFILLFEQNGNAKKSICGPLPFAALRVNPAMTTSAAERHGRVEKSIRP